MSDPEGAVQTMTLESQATGRPMDVVVITPPGYDPAARDAYPVVYFLHPWGLSPRYILDKLHMHRHAWSGQAHGELPPLVIVLPSGTKSFFLNAADPPGQDWTPVVQLHEEFFRDALQHYGRYGDYFRREVLPYVETHFRVRTDRAGRAIGGISMGGTAAVVHALSDEQPFCALGIHSPALFSGPPENGGPPWIFGLEPDSFAARNPADVVRAWRGQRPPRIALDTGDRDLMRGEVEALHRALDAAGLDHQFAIEPGGHDKTYWEPRMRRYLAFYAADWLNGAG